LSSFKPHDLERTPLKVSSQGFVLAECPKHPYAWKRDGCVHFHRLVMENHLGRYLREDEFVFHKDEDRKNNDIENLRIVIRSPATRVYKPRSAPPKRICGVCKEGFRPEWLECKANYSDSKYCSDFCRAEAKRSAKKKAHAVGRDFKKIEPPSREELAALIWEYPSTKLAEKFGVSDRTVGNWCKRYGIDKPPRGYWASIRSRQ